MPNQRGQSTIERRSSMFTRRMVFSSAVFWVLVIAILPLSGRGVASETQEVVTVKMVDMPPVFQPATITIRTGETVEWKNIGNEVHHATSDPSLAIKNSDVGNPPGAQAFDSGFLKPGETFTHTFKTPGMYRYACAVHETKGMVGEIIVK